MVIKLHNTQNIPIKRFKSRSRRSELLKKYYPFKNLLILSELNLMTNMTDFITEPNRKRPHARQ